MSKNGWPLLANENHMVYCRQPLHGCKGIMNKCTLKINTFLKIIKKLLINSLLISSSFKF